AGTLRLLTDRAVLERDALVLDARGEAAWTERREHRVAPFKGCEPVGGGGDGDVESAGARELLGEDADQLEPVRIEVDEHDLGAVEVLAVVHERRHRPRGTRRTSAQVHKLDLRHFVTP